MSQTEEDVSVAPYGTITLSIENDGYAFVRHGAQNRKRVVMLNELHRVSSFESACAQLEQHGFIVDRTARTFSPKEKT